MSKYAHGDPLLKGRDWEAIKRYHRAQRAPCARCGGVIEYDAGPDHPRSLHVGHIVGRAEGRAMGWTRAQINHVSNTQAECRTCSTRAGARDGNAARSSTRQAPLEECEW